jgi:hypothetical protein
MGVWCGPANEHTSERPCIVLLQDPGIDDEWSFQVGAGCEEEGIPLAWRSRSGNAHELARYAASESHLEVGIGLSGSEGAITFAKYPEKTAYLHETLKGPSYLRWLGQAAARFVKREPVPPLPDGELVKTSAAETPCREEPALGTDQEKVIEDLVSQILTIISEEGGR